MVQSKSGRGYFRLSVDHKTVGNWYFRIFCPCARLVEIVVVDLKQGAMSILAHFRHPEVRAQRASKGDGQSAAAASFEGRFAAASG